MRVRTAWATAGLSGEGSVVQLRLNSGEREEEALVEHRLRLFAEVVLCLLRAGHGERRNDRAWALGEARWAAQQAESGATHFLRRGMPTNCPTRQA